MREPRKRDLATGCVGGFCLWELGTMVGEVQLQSKQSVFAIIDLMNKPLLSSVFAGKEVRDEAKALRRAAQNRVIYYRVRD
jgi:hypothetical protein